MSILKHVDFEVPNFGELAVSPLAVPSYSSAVVSLSPVAYWRLGEQSGTTLADEMGNYPLSLSDSPVFSQAGALKYDEDTATHFNGAAAAAGVPILPAGTNAPFTMAFWVRIPPGPADAGAYMGQYTSNITGQTRFQILDTAQLRVTIIKGIYFNSTEIVDTSWRFAVATRSSTGVFRWFVDGQFDSEYTGAGQDLTPIPFVMGQVTTNSIDIFLDEVAIFHHELTADQIRWLYGLARGELALPDAL